MEEVVVHYFRTPGLTQAATDNLLRKSRKNVSEKIVKIETEFCYNIQISSEFTPEQKIVLTWLLSESYNPKGFGSEPFLKENDEKDYLTEVGPRLNFSTAWSTNAISIFHACGLDNIPRAECSRRYLLHCSEPLTAEEKDAFTKSVHDRMTEQPYLTRLTSFKLGIEPAPIKTYPVLARGKEELKELDAEFGLSFDEQDLAYYTHLFCDILKRDPTDVELFDIAQSNSEHSRHWFFGGNMVIDGEKKDRSLFRIVKDTLTEERRSNSVIAFNDNSSAIRGFEISTIQPETPGKPSKFVQQKFMSHILLSAETHNFPSGVAPFPGAETGTGGRIRDVQATGTGANVTAGTAAYAVGSLNIPGYDLPWEEKWEYPSNLAKPLTIEIEASNGASDYGNKFGEPVITGFTRSFGLRLPNGERREYIKPIMFSGGVGQLDDRHLHKGQPEKGMLVVKVGGPAYRIGLGGGAASSRVQDAAQAALDFDAVQRGDAEMENKMNRVIRAAIECRGANPIVSIHDQGAGGNGNVLKEISAPNGAELDIRKVVVGDPTMSVRELWGAEFQENDAILIRPEDREFIEEVGRRENVPVMILGEITDTGHMVVKDSKTGETAVDLDLELVLGDMPKKTFVDHHVPLQLQPLTLPADLTVRGALDRVLRLLSVGSKRFLTTKVDRSVTGLIARQQCCGPLHLPLSDVAVFCQSHFATTGCATAIGEQPVKGLVNPAAMGRLTVGEACTNLVWAAITDLADVKCSGNWMWASKLEGEGAAMYDCCEAMGQAMLELGVAVDGGKDSLSMAAKVGDELVKAPGTLVVSVYAACPDVSLTVTPDLKHPGASVLLFVDLSAGHCRLGGSALAQTFKQVGDDCPDCDTGLLDRGFRATQRLLRERVLLAGHDRSDGGLITTLLEMAFGGNCGLDVELRSETASLLSVLFCEELGLVVEVAEADVPRVLEAYREAQVPVQAIGRSVAADRVTVRFNGEVVLEDAMTALRDLWEATSFELEKLQCNPECVAQEQAGLKKRHAPRWELTYTPRETPAEWKAEASKFKVAIIREEGSNGDREMAAAMFAAGFEPWDVHVRDLLSGAVTLDAFRGVVFVGGFSYADVLESARGWAATILFNKELKEQFDRFYARPDTFSLGICNGCQLMAQLNFVPWRGIEETKQPRFLQNKSGRFESRFVNVRVEKSNAVMLQGMEGSTLGVWVCHGEGRCFWPDEEVRKAAFEQNCVALRYVDDDGQPTMEYPMNPNGSEYSVVGLTSPDGRHLCMMPHPERVFMKFQWPYWPEKWTNPVSPWLKMFQNAREWCESHSRVCSKKNNEKIRFRNIHQVHRRRGRQPDLEDPSTID